MHSIALYKVETQILRLTSECSSIYPHVSMAVKICFHCSWDAKFASLQAAAIVMIWRFQVYSIAASKSRDARYCVSRVSIHQYIRTFLWCENMLLYLVRRKILRLYMLAPLLWYYVTDAWNDILYIIIYNICCIDFTTFTVLYRCPISLASVVFKYTSLLSPSIRQSFISLARTFL